MIKKYYLLILFLLLFSNIYLISQQGGGVAISDKEDQLPHSSAILDLISTNKGFLMPVIVDKENIEDPDEFLIIFNDDSECFETYTDGYWHQIYCFDYCEVSLPADYISGVEEICNGEEIVLTVEGGELGTGASWQWYVGECGEYYGGISIGQGVTRNVSPSVTSDYYVRAEGDCAITDCVSFNVKVNYIPDSPEESEHIVNQEEIEWVWSSVHGADSYRFYTDNDCEEAHDIGDQISIVETDLDCGESYTRYVWSYNDYCGCSEVTILEAETEPCE